MVNSILDAVTAKLGITFGNSYHYYLESVEQGLLKPCFTVDVLIPTQRSKSKILYDRTFPLVIHYFSDRETDLKKDCYSIAERAVECLEYLPLNSTLIRGEDITWQVVDEVLQIFVTYRLTTKLVVDAEETPQTLDATISNK